jgi:hypothetical protein
MSEEVSRRGAEFADKTLTASTLSAVSAPLRDFFTSKENPWQNLVEKLRRPITADGPRAAGHAKIVAIR